MSNTVRCLASEDLSCADVVFPDFDTHKAPMVLAKENLSSPSVMIILFFLLLRFQKASRSMCFAPQTENLGFTPFFFFFKRDIFHFLNSRNLPQFVKLIWCFDGGNLAPRTGSCPGIGAV